MSCGSGARLFIIVLMILSILDVLIFCPTRKYVLKMGRGWFTRNKYSNLDNQRVILTVILTTTSLKSSSSYPLIPVDTMGLQEKINANPTVYAVSTPARKRFNVNDNLDEDTFDPFEPDEIFGAW